MGATTKGSPPRVRGKGTSSASTTALFRITPAYAGKSNMIFLRQHVRKDHPRVCGEKHPSTAIRQRNTGSPSRMRGKAVHHKHRHSPGRITPAHAGKRTRPRRWVRPPRDHPRACGEKITDETIGVVIQGSPPRVRGKARGASLLCQHLRITPACAGKSSIQHLTASLGEFEVQKGHPVPHLRQRLQVWPDHARHLRHGLILHASRSTGQGRRLCPGPCPDTAGSGTPRGPSPAKRPHRSPPAATPGGYRAWQSGATAPGSR